MPNLTLRGCCIGTGRPKVIIPIVERTESAILEKAAAFSTLKADCVEWRADWFDAVSDVNALAHCLHGLRAALGEKLLLVTFRTQAEGGEKPLAQEEYAAFCTTVCASGCADLLDIEFFPNRKALPALIAQAHAAGIAVVCSSHDFEKTPPKEELTDLHPETPVITMSMGALGGVSRLCGEAFGSAMTFANPGTASAPGQVPLDVVNAVLDSLAL